MLDGKNNLYFIKGDNPLCIYHYPTTGVYLYASTKEILIDALSHIPYKLGKPTSITLDCGGLLKIGTKGQQFRSEFDTQNLFRRWYSSYHFMLDPPARRGRVSVTLSPNEEYLQSLKTAASFYGYAAGYIDALLADGFTTDDVEEMLYCGEL